MDITETELDAVRLVLDGKVSRSTAACTYSNRLKTILAAAILQGAEPPKWDLISPRGIYTYIMVELVVFPGLRGLEVHEDEHGELIWPSWLPSRIDATLLAHARKLGFHKLEPGQQNPTFLGHSALAVLFQEDKGRAGRCREWYVEARKEALEHEGNAFRVIKKVPHPAEELRRDFDDLVSSLEGVQRLPYKTDEAGMSRFAQQLREHSRRVDAFLKERNIEL